MTLSTTPVGFRLLAFILTFIHYHSFLIVLRMHDFCNFAVKKRHFLSWRSYIDSTGLMYESKIHAHLQGLTTKTMHVLDHHAALSPITLQKTTPSLGPTPRKQCDLPHRTWGGFYYNCFELFCLTVDLHKGSDFGDVGWWFIFSYFKQHFFSRQIKKIFSSRFINTGGCVIWILFSKG